MNFTQQQEELNRLSGLKSIIEQIEFSNLAINLAEQAVAATYQFNSVVPFGTSPTIRTYEKDIFAASFLDKIEKVKSERLQLTEVKATLIPMMQELIDFYNPVHINEG